MSLSNIYDPRELAKRTLEAEWQRTGKVVTVTVVGSSMMPTLGPSQEVEIAFSASPDLHSGCLIYFRRGRKRVLHRLLLRVGPVCLEKGDSNRYPRPVRTSNVLGTGQVIQG